MKYRLVLSALLLLSITASAQGQRNMSPDQLRDPATRARLERERERQEMRDAQADMRMMEVYKPKPKLDPVRARQLEIANTLKLLSETSDKLVQTVEAPGNVNFKEVAELAEKISKYSKQLRKDLNLMDPSCKLQPMPIPEGDQAGQLKQLARTMDVAIKQVTEKELVSSYNIKGYVAGRIPARKQYELVECLAASTRTLARKKN